jgi:hypothetical protein
MKQLLMMGTVAMGRVCVARRVSLHFCANAMGFTRARGDLKSRYTIPPVRFTAISKSTRWSAS